MCEVVFRSGASFIYLIKNSPRADCCKTLVFRTMEYPGIRVHPFGIPWNPPESARNPIRISSDTARGSQQFVLSCCFSADVLTSFRHPFSVENAEDRQSFMSLRARGPFARFSNADALSTYTTREKDHELLGWRPRVIAPGCPVAGAPL